MLVELLWGLLISMVLICMLLFLEGYCWALVMRRNSEFVAISMNRQLSNLFESDFFIRRVSDVYVCSNDDKEDYIIAFWERTEGKKKFILYFFRTKKDNAIFHAKRFVIDLTNIPKGLSDEYLDDLISEIEAGEYKRPSEKIYDTPISDLCKTATLKEIDGLLLFQNQELSYYF